MTLKHLLLFIFALSTSLNVWGQQRPKFQAARPNELSGMVRDSLTGEPNANAVVRINFEKKGLYTETTGTI